MNNSHWQLAFSWKYCARLMVAAVIVESLLQLPQPQSVRSQQVCEGIELYNQATYSYASEGVVVQGATSKLRSRSVRAGRLLRVTSAGIRNAQGGVPLASALGGFRQQLLQNGLTPDEATLLVLTLSQAWLRLTPNRAIADMTAATDRALNQSTAKLPQLAQPGRARSTVLFINYFLKASLLAAGLNSDEVQQAVQAAQTVWQNAPDTVSLAQLAERAVQAMGQAVPSKTEAINNLYQSLTAEVGARRQQRGYQGQSLTFRNLITNPGTESSSLQLPIAASGSRSSTIPLQPNSQIEITTTLQILEPPATGATLSMGFIPASDGNLQMRLTGPGRVTDISVRSVDSALDDRGAGATNSISNCIPEPVEETIVLPPTDPSLVDPLGRITGCDGGLLADYTGISVGLYDPADPGGLTGEVSRLVALTPTEVPDRPNNDIPLGLEPNTENSNPYFLTNSNQGNYSFLLDEQRGQLREGSTYILIVKTPPNSDLGERRIRIVIGARTGNTVRYTATALDGLPITGVAKGGDPIQPSDNSLVLTLGTVLNGELEILDANAAGLGIALLSVSTNICESQALQIIKTGDRAAAEPGDTVIYRLAVRNLSTTSVNNLTITDTLPLGLQLRQESPKAELNGTPVPISTTTSGSTVTFQFPGFTLPATQTLNLAYAATLTPDALRGSGINSAIANGQRADNGIPVKDGPATFRLRIRPGILSDCGTILGRVFVDSNFDGEQQKGEPGVPNAVIFLDDGNRITTDVNGLFSLSCVLPGHRTGVLDLTSLPGYRLAPNLRFKEQNSPSRLVRLSPGGMVRMNFAVTPSTEKEN